MCLPLFVHLASLDHQNCCFDVFTAGAVSVDPIHSHHEQPESISTKEHSHKKLQAKTLPLVLMLAIAVGAPREIKQLSK